MVYSALKGGLGNMMFEIAAMSSLAIDNNDSVAFINIAGQLAYLNNETNFNPNMTHANDYMFLLEKFNHPAPDTYVKQFNVPYHFEKLEYIDGAFYDGFFQSEKWFMHNREKIIEILQPSIMILQEISFKYNHLLNLPNTVAVHLRRGDYVKNQGNHALLPLEYYQNAFQLFSPETNFIFFSDDIQYCKDTFKLQNQYFIENEKDYIELYLMSMFENQIIANSSFSWWAAWLNIRYNKKVIAPKIWFGPNIKHNTADVIPETWIKI